VRLFLFVALAAALAIAASIDTVHAANQTMPPPGSLRPPSLSPRRTARRFLLRVSRQMGRALLLSQGHDLGCTIEAHNFQRDLPQFEARNAVILGVSEDTPGSHQQFCTKEGLTFRLLADTQHQVAAAYGSLGSFAGFKIANRNTFLIDPTGKIVQVWTRSIHPPPRPCAGRPSRFRQRRRACRAE